MKALWLFAKELMQSFLNSSLKHLKLHWKIYRKEFFQWKFFSNIFIKKNIFRYFHKFHDEWINVINIIKKFLAKIFSLENSLKYLHKIHIGENLISNTKVYLFI